MNVVLIGMPGSGKSFIGKLVAFRLGMRFTDVDSMIEQDTRMSISKIFELYGEGCFREIEAEAVCKVSGLDNMVISTGGGAVLKEENIENLRKCGKIFFINRDISNILKAEGLRERPLLKSDSELNLKKLYDDRIFLYNKYADFVVDNNSEVGDAVSSIVNIVRKEL